MDKDWINIDNSCIVNPKGNIISGSLEKGEGLLIADIDLSEIVQSKRLFDVTGHYSHPDVFEYRVNRQFKVFNPKIEPLAGLEPATF